MTAPAVEAAAPVEEAPVYAAQPMAEAGQVMYAQPEGAQVTYAAPQVTYAAAEPGQVTYAAQPGVTYMTAPAVEAAQPVYSMQQPVSYMMPQEAPQVTYLQQPQLLQPQQFQFVYQQPGVDAGYLQQFQQPGTYLMPAAAATAAAAGPRGAAAAARRDAVRPVHGGAVPQPAAATGAACTWGRFNRADGCSNRQLFNKGLEEVLQQQEDEAFQEEEDRLLLMIASRAWLSRTCTAATPCQGSIILIRAGRPHVRPSHGRFGAAKG